MGLAGFLGGVHTSEQVIRMKRDTKLKEIWESVKFVACDHTGVGRTVPKEKQNRGTSALIIGLS